MTDVCPRTCRAPLEALKLVPFEHSRGGDAQLADALSLLPTDETRDGAGETDVERRITGNGTAPPFTLLVTSGIGRLYP